MPHTVQQDLHVIWLKWCCCISREAFLQRASFLEFMDVAVAGFCVPLVGIGRHSHCQHKISQSDVPSLKKILLH